MQVCEFIFTALPVPHSGASLESPQYDPPEADKSAGPTPVKFASLVPIGNLTEHSGAGRLKE